MKLNKLFGLGLTLSMLSAAAQTVTDPDWKESDSPPPPAFSTKQLIRIEMPKYVSLRLGVDPQTLSITPDRIVRYVVVAINSAGSTSAMYEGIRCATEEVKTYARYGAEGRWSVVDNAKWQGLYDNLPSKHAIALVRQGLCDGHSPATLSVPAMIKLLTAANENHTLF